MAKRRCTCVCRNADCKQKNKKYNIFGYLFIEIFVEVFNCFDDGAVIDPVALIEAGLVKNIRDGIRVLGNGELTKKVTVKAMGFSKTAQSKIEAAGGKVEVI